MVSVGVLSARQDHPLAAATRRRCFTVYRTLHQLSGSNVVLHDRIGHRRWTCLWQNQAGDDHQVLALMLDWNIAHGLAIAAQR